MQLRYQSVVKEEGSRLVYNIVKSAMTLEAIERLSGTPLRELRKRIERIIKPVRMLVFGSYARGDFHEESDVDVLIVVSDYTENLRDVEERIIREVIEFNLEHGTFVSSIVLRESEARFLPVGRRALKEGVEIER